MTNQSVYLDGKMCQHLMFEYDNSCERNLWRKINKLVENKECNFSINCISKYKTKFIFNLFLYEKVSM